METVVLNRFESKMWVNRIVLNSLQCNRIIDCGKLLASERRRSRRKNAYSLDKQQQTLANTGFFRWIVDRKLAKVGQNWGWPIRDINALLETRDNYCDILFKTGWTLFNCLLLALIGKTVGVFKHRRKNAYANAEFAKGSNGMKFIENSGLRIVGRR